LTRFYLLFDSVLKFLESKDPDLKENLIKLKADMAYLTDLFKRFNDINLQLQGDSLNLIKTKGAISASLGKLKFMKQNKSWCEFSQFPNLSQAKCLDEDLQTYVRHLKALHDDFKNRSEDILAMEIPPWIINPFDETELQEELLELNTNEELKVKFKEGYQTFWLQTEIPPKYPGMCEIARKLLIAIPSSYVAEKGFGVVTNLLTKTRSRLNITKRGVLQLFLTKLKPNIDNLLSIHQVHSSH
ncbi:SCAN domain-containing protein 3-like, partial [Sceloporus undulatus]|uniref:SCAN domain-containing protein 3-like n=1 Tax=Sceloporus undulatus TaxID=8520 RepID=UPI001C4D4110